jgi:glycosyltransferase involved in cell wall biosynthesis
MPLSLSRARSAGGGGLVTVGRLTPQKRFHLALEAHRRLLETHPSLRLTVIGDGPERPRLEALVRQLGTGDRVTFLGQLATTEVAAAIGDADLCLFPAKDEGLGLGAIEALAVGVPVVGCRDGGGLRDILEQPGAGILVEADPDTLAAAAESLLGSATARDDAARAGEAWRERLAPERVALQFEEAYREAGRG